MVSVGVIPARFASTRFPGKPLVKIAGRPLLEHVIEAVLKSRMLSEVLVATDHPEIAEISRQAGARAVMTDPDLPSGTDRVWAALKVAGLTGTDVVLNIQGDEPLIQAEPIDALVAIFEGRPNLDMATLGREMDLATSEGLEALNSVTTAKITLDANDQALYFSRFPIPFSRVKPQAEGAKAQSWPGQEPKVPKSILKHIGIYAYRPRFLEKFCAAPPSELEIFEGLEQLRALSLGAKIHVVRTRLESWGVDTPEDVEKIEKMLHRRS
jgi:3-deoxy-manno-octulosonate cytidylyltransferase (CMP-KDO synthetase)